MSQCKHGPHFPTNIDYYPLPHLLSNTKPDNTCATKANFSANYWIHIPLHIRMFARCDKAAVTEPPASS